MQKITDEEIQGIEEILAKQRKSNSKELEKDSTKKISAKKYTQEDKLLFMAIFEGSANINNNGKVVVQGKEWDWTDPIVQHFVDKSRRMKKWIENYFRSELEGMFGKL
jgi:hypothetical protein